MSNFKEKTILVTGGTNGIGKTIAQHFYDEKAIVYLTGTNNSLINKINSKNDPRMIAIMSDFSSKGVFSFCCFFFGGGSASSIVCVFFHSSHF